MIPARLRIGQGSGETLELLCLIGLASIGLVPIWSNAVLPLQDLPNHLLKAHVLQVYNRVPVVFVRGSGGRLYDADSKEYVDLLSGIGVASLGHAHAGLADALDAQARELAHTSNLYFHPLQGVVAGKLSAISFRLWRSPRG